MQTPYLIGVDLGTSVVKGTLFDAEGVAVADCTYPVALAQPELGSAEQRGDEYYAATLNTIRDVAEQGRIKSADIAAIALAGQMAGAIGITVTGTPLRPGFRLHWTHAIKFIRLRWWRKQ